MKIGDRVICIDSDNINSRSRNSLTVGKEYLVLDVEFSSGVEDDDVGSYLITVVNNNGNQFGYYEFRFKTLREYRKDKLKNINLYNENRCNRMF